MRTSDLILAATAAMALAGSAWAQDAAPPPSGDPDRGGDVYAAHCALCHGAHLNDAEWAPALKGARFQRTWAKSGPAALFGYISRAMPPGQAGQLSAQDYADLVAFLDRENGVAPPNGAKGP